MDFVWRKIAAAGDMKSAIKRALAEAQSGTASPHGVGSTRKASWVYLSSARVRELREAMEAYLNCLPTQSTSSSPEPSASPPSS